MTGAPQNLGVDAFPVGHFGLSGRLGIAGSAALQAVSECPRRRQAGIVKDGQDGCLRQSKNVVYNKT